MFGIHAIGVEGEMILPVKLLMKWEELEPPAGAELHVRVAPPKFLKISFYYIEIFNISIISPQKWDLPPLPSTI